MTITFDEIKTLATQLTYADKLRLMDELAAQVGQAVPQGDDLAAPPIPDAWARWTALRADLQTSYAALGPEPPTAGEQLERDRNERQALVEGQRDVHP